MKKNFVIFLLVTLFCNECLTCFLTDSESNRSITTSTRFYEECCCSEPEYTINDLYWLDPSNATIGPGTDSNVYIELQDGCIALHIPTSSKSLAGAYKCVGVIGKTIHIQTHNLDVYDPLYFFNTTETQFLIYGRDSMLYCQAKGASPPLIRWYRGKDGETEIYNDTLKYQFMPEGLIVKNVTDDDGEIYKCTASVLSTGEEVEIDIIAQVMTEPTIISLTASPEDTVRENESLIINCQSEGLPAPNFNWRKIVDTTKGDEERNVTWLQDSNTIRFDAIEAEDAGIYECYAHNFVGNSSQTIEIKVQIPPKIIEFNNKTVEEGSAIAIHCNATGIPEPNVTITFEGKSLENENDYVFIPNFSVIMKVNRSNEGYYICNATNDVDFESVHMYLNVLHKPQFDENFDTVWGWNGQSVDLDCTHDANPESNLTWRYQKSAFAIAEEINMNEDLNTKEQITRSQNISFQISEHFAPYGIFECKAINKMGEAYKTINLRKGFRPSAVQNATLLDVTATTATFAIEPPIDYEGPDLLGFTAEYDIAENYNVTHIHTNRTWAIGRPFKVEKLKRNSTYYVRFAAVNKVGYGHWGAMLEFETPPKSAPEPPTWQVESLQFSPNNVLKWKEPEDSGAPIDYYSLRYCQVAEDWDESLCKEQRIETTEKHLSDLQYNTTYFFELTAHNSEGNSTAANISLTIKELESADFAPFLSGGAIIGISVVVVLICLLLLDLLLLFWRRQGIIASCCLKKNKKKPNPLHSRDKKGLLKDNGESTDDTLRRPNNGHREYEYNKTTGIITGKHSSV